MKNYVVGYLSFLDKNLILKKLAAENEYEAAKKAILEIAENASKEAFDSEKEWQESGYYPKDFESLKTIKNDCDTVLEVIEI